MDDYINTAKRIIEESIYMTIATASKEGKPWISPVFFAYDEKYNLYWVSSKEARHSKLIKENPQVAIVIFDSSAPEGDGDGVYFEAKVSELSENTDIDGGIKLFNNRAGKDEFKIKSNREVTGNGIWRIYKASPQKAYKLTEGEFVNGQYVDKKIEINL